LTDPLMRLYRGHRFPEWTRCPQLATRQALLDAMDESQDDKVPGLLRTSYYDFPFNNFPREDRLVRPTRLGNVLTAAEEYSYQTYRLDATVWWSRLTALLSEAFTEKVDAALTPLLSLLNLSALLTLLALVGGGVLFFTDQDWLLFVSVFVGGLILAW